MIMTNLQSSSLNLILVTKRWCCKISSQKQMKMLYKSFTNQFFSFLFMSSSHQLWIHSLDSLPFHCSFNFLSLIHLFIRNPSPLHSYSQGFPCSSRSLGRRYHFLILFWFSILSCLREWFLIFFGFFSWCLLCRYPEMIWFCYSLLLPISFVHNMMTSNDNGHKICTEWLSYSFSHFLYSLQTMSTTIARK